MQGYNLIHNTGAKLEEIRNQNKTILGGLLPVPQISKGISQLKDDVFRIKKRYEGPKNSCERPQRSVQ